MKLRIGRWKRDQNDADARGESSWERSGFLFANLLPYGTLIAALVLAWVQPGQSWQQRGEVLLLTALAAAWVYFLYTRACRDRWAQPLRMIVYFGGFLALAAALMALNPIYFLFAVTGFIHAAVLRPWPLVFLGVGLTSTAINTVITGFPWLERESWIFYGALIIFQTLASGMGILFVERVTVLSDQRKQAVARLEAALKENEGLQAQLLTQAKEAGILEERQRLAREIHDTLAQGLIGIITQLESARQSETNPVDRQRRFDHALRLARESLTEARRSVHALRPGPLVTAGLPEVLARTAHEWSALHGVQAKVLTTGDPVALHPDVEAAILRTAQEALMNVAKHAQASRVGITLSYMGAEVALDIRDDGTGFDLSAAHGNGDTAGFGLAAMRDRMRHVAGSVEIESEPGGGTAISARVPVHGASPESVAG